MQHVAEVTSIENVRENVETDFLKPVRYVAKRKVTVTLGHDYNSPVRGSITFPDGALDLGQQVKVTIEAA